MLTRISRILPFRGLFIIHLWPPQSENFWLPLPSLQQPSDFGLIYLYKAFFFAKAHNVYKFYKYDKTDRKANTR